MNNTRKKKLKENLAKALMWGAMSIVLVLVVSVVWTIFSKGCKAMSWDMISKLPGGGFYIGKDGGFLNAIVGSLYIVGASTVLGLLVSIPVVFFPKCIFEKRFQVGIRDSPSFLCDVWRAFHRIWGVWLHHHDIFWLKDLSVGWYYCHHSSDYSYFYSHNGWGHTQLSQRHFGC